MSWSDPGHPIWPLARIVCFLGFALGFLWVYATKFDETELATLERLFYAVVGVEASFGVFTKRARIKKWWDDKRSS